MARKAYIAITLLVQNFDYHDPAVPGHPCNTLTVVSVCGNDTCYVCAMAVIIVDLVALIWGPQFIVTEAPAIDVIDLAISVVVESVSWYFAGVDP